MPRASAAEPPAAASRSVESEQLRGPVHEAFAQPLVNIETPGVSIDRRPSAAWHEMPSAIKPASASAIWIPGYWAWDPAEKDLLWVPGIWRIPPPGMRWVPGYWNERDDGWRWVGGFWSPLDQPRLRYLPPPPPSNDGPPAPASDGRFAVAGHWTYITGRYVWSDGFSAAHKKGWVWTPSHYVNTPRGALFLPGYWDYPLDARGLLFAPARGAPPATSFTPSVAVNLAELPEALFSGTGFGHFYFGDYFDGDRGDINPWYEPNGTPGLDPLFAYERWRHQLIDAEWAEELADRYRRRRDNTELRPSLRMIGGQAPFPAEDKTPRLGVWISDLARGRDRSRGVTELGKEAHRRVAQNAESFKLLAVQRAKFESSGEAAGRDKPVAFYLPVPVEPLEPDRSASPERAATTGQFVPGVAGRRVPGTRDRTLPGTSGRTLPGVDSNIPGALGPGTASPPRR